MWKFITGEEQEVERPLANTSKERSLEYAFKRRGICLETAGLMSYNKHEVWRNRLFDALNEEPAPGDVAPTVADILKADEKIWLLLESETRDGIQPKSSVRPLETALDEILKRYEVTSRLICKQGVNARASTQSSAKGTIPPGSSSQDKKDRRIVNQSNEIKNLKKKLGGGSDSVQARPGKKSKVREKARKANGRRRSLPKEGENSYPCRSL